MNLTFKSNAKKAIAKTKLTIRKNAISTVKEIAEDIRPELSQMKSDLTRAALGLKKDILKKIS